MVSSARSRSTSICSTSPAVLIADVDGDARLDVIAGADNGQELAWYHNESGAQADLRFVKYSISTKARPTSLAFSDLDGDRDDELAVAAYSMTASVSLAIFEPPRRLRRALDPHRDRPRLRLRRSEDSPRGRDRRLRRRRNSRSARSPAWRGGDLRVYRKSGTEYVKQRRARRL